MEVGLLCRADLRKDKIDLGIGTYRDNDGLVPVMTVVKEAERRLQETQTTKAYLGVGGDAGFCDLLREEIFPDLASARDGRLACIQAPGGTGALRLGMDLIGRARPGCAVLVGTPTWPNHPSLLDEAGLQAIGYRHYDRATGETDFAAMCDAVSGARPRDMLLLHGCCHNPTGAGLNSDQWATLTGLLERTGVVPLVDLAYAGMADGIDADVAGVRLMLERLPEALVALSCSKNFALYRERTGMLIVQAANADRAAAARMNAEVLARLLWSNPPAHGAAIVSTVLGDPELRTAWRAELEQMRRRVRELRERLAASRSGIDLGHLAGQQGLFAILPLDAAKIRSLRSEQGIYIDASGRINIAGLNDGNTDRFLDALAG